MLAPREARVTSPFCASLLLLRGRRGLAGDVDGTDPLIKPLHHLVSCVRAWERQLHRARIERNACAGGLNHLLHHRRGQAIEFLERELTGIFEVARGRDLAGAKLLGPLLQRLSARSERGIGAQLFTGLPGGRLLDRLLFLRDGRALRLQFALHLLLNLGKPCGHVAASVAAGDNALDVDDDHRHGALRQRGGGGGERSQHDNCREQGFAETHRCVLSFELELSAGGEPEALAPVVCLVFERLGEIELHRTERGIPEQRNARRSAQRQLILDDEPIGAADVDRLTAGLIQCAQGPEIHERGGVNAKQFRQSCGEIELDCADGEGVAPEGVAALNDGAIGVAHQQLPRANAGDIEAAEAGPAFEEAVVDPDVVAAPAEHVTEARPKARAPTRANAVIEPAFEFRANIIHLSARASDVLAEREIEAAGRMNRLIAAVIIEGVTDHGGEERALLRAQQ